MTQTPTIEGEDPNQIPLWVQGAPAQAANLMRITDSDGNIKFAIDKDGNMTGSLAQPLQYITAYDTLQAAVDALPAQHFITGGDAGLPEDGRITGGGVLYIPTGIHEVSHCDWNKPYSSLIGANWKGTQLNFMNADGTSAFTFHPESPNLYLHAYLVFRDFSAIGRLAHEIDHDTGQWIYTDHNGYAISTGDFFTTTSSSYYTFDHLNINSFGGRGIQIDGTPYACIYGRINNSRILYCKDGIRMINDCRVWGINDTSVFTGHRLLDEFDAPNFDHGVQLASCYTVDMNGGSIEGPLSGMGQAGCHSCDVDGTYFEQIEYGIGCGNNTIASRFTNIFMYASYYPISVGDGIHSCTFKDIEVQGNYGGQNDSLLLSGPMDGCVADNITVRDTNEPSLNHHWNDVGITTPPKYWEHTIGGQGAIPGLMFGTPGVSVKTTTGAPTDAVYGSQVGKMVYNSFDKVMWVHGPDGTNDWDVV